MQVARGVEMLEIAAVVLGRADTIYPTMLWDGETAILVDTGFPGQANLVRGAMQEAGVTLDRLNKIILTHQDLDHIGSLPAILQECPQRVEVLTSAGEKPYIQGEKRLVKMTPERIAQAVAALPPEVPQERRQAFRATLENPPHAAVDRTLADGEELPDCGGIVVIATPGHTPGHLCLYHRPTQTLLAGDALRVKEGQLVGPRPDATLDMVQALQSLQNLLPYQIARVICYHGGLYTGEVNRRIAELAH